MCGISAIFRFIQITDSDEEKLSLMNQEMHYRGPDDNGIWTDSLCGLAHTRLSVIGLENGKQPMFNEDKSLVLVCNGEIYNYIELRESLEAKGHVFNSDTDSETILHLYEEYGVRCVNHLRGMFAFCIWDTRTKQLFAARDRIGEKTLYYAQIPTGIVFCTELKTILKYFIQKPQLNLKSLAEPIRYNYPINRTETFIEQIKRLIPGHYAIVDQNGISIKKYWDLFHKKTYIGYFEQARNECLNILIDSVRKCLRSDVPVGVLLSGGIDSSTIAALAKESVNEVHVITAGYKGQHNCDERYIARRFAKEKGLIFHEIELDEKEFKKYFEEYIYLIDEPVCDVASMAQWALYKKAKSLGFTVLLSGNGGDELFFGYPYENSIAEALKVSHIHQDFFPLCGNTQKISFLRFIFHNWRDILSAGYRKAYNSKYIQGWTYNSYQKFALGAMVDFGNTRYSLKDINLNFTLDGENRNEIELIYQQKYQTFLCNLSLYLADRLGMGNAIEIRSPFTDYKLIEFVAGLPIEFRYKKGETKFLLKETIKGIIPNYILSAEKRGFEPPFAFIDEIHKNYEYKIIKNEEGFFNSMVADKLLSILLNQHV